MATRARTTRKATTSRRSKSSAKPKRTRKVYGTGLSKSASLAVSQSKSTLSAAIKRFQSLSRRRVIFFISVIILGVASIQFRYLLIPASVNNRPIYIWSFLRELNKTAGPEVLDRLIVENLINQEIDSMGITISQSEIDEEIAKFNEQFSQSGGIDAFLANQGMTLNQLKELVTLNKKIEKALSDKISISEEEVNTSYEENKEFMPDKDEGQAKIEIRESLKNQKLQQEVTVWIEQLRTKASVKISLPQINGLN